MKKESILYHSCFILSLSVALDAIDTTDYVRDREHDVREVLIRRPRDRQVLERKDGERSVGDHRLTLSWFRSTDLAARYRVRSPIA